MSRKVDWVKYVEELENLLSNKISGIDIEKDGKTEEVAEKSSPAEASLLQKIIHKDLVEDLNPPLFSVKSFEALSLYAGNSDLQFEITGQKPSLLRGVYAMGFNTPSKIQETALPTLLANPPQNLIVQSQPGTGKTVAFVLVMLSRVDPKKHYPQVLCLSPTYEQAIQTGKIVARMGQFCPEIICKLAVRGQEVPRNSKLTDHIIIGTPGKVLDWGVKYRVFDLLKITVFVLVEANDLIATQGHQDQCIRIHKCLNKKCQMMFFSATYDDDVMEFAEVIVRNPLIIRLPREQESLDNIKQYFVRCVNQQEKYMAVTNIYVVLGVGKSIIFCHTRHKANWLAKKMSKDGHVVALLTGELTGEQRVSVLDCFRDSEQKVLITTNILSQGINVEQVTIVVNFDLPVDENDQANCEIYLHRICRTGRYGKSGIAINLIDTKESMQVCKNIEAHFGKKIHPLNTNDWDEMEKIAY